MPALSPHHALWWPRISASEIVQIRPVQRKPTCNPSTIAMLVVILNTLHIFTIDSGINRKSAM